MYIYIFLKRIQIANNDNDNIGYRYTIDGMRISLDSILFSKNTGPLNGGKIK